MMYPFLQLADQTEIVHSELRADGCVKVYIETPVSEGFKSATCFLPDYRWEGIEGFSEQDISRFKDIIESYSHLIMQTASTTPLTFEELVAIEEIGDKYGWVAPLTDEDRAYFKHFRSVFKRYNITPSKATKLEYDFVIRVAESEFYLQSANPTLTDEDGEYFIYFQSVCKRYNIIPSKATKLEYDFVTRVTDSEFYPQK